MSQGQFGKLLDQLQTMYVDAAAERDERRADAVHYRDRLDAACRAVTVVADGLPPGPHRIALRNIVFDMQPTEEELRYGRHHPDPDPD